MITTTGTDASERKKAQRKRVARNVLIGFAAAVLAAGCIGGAYVYSLVKTFNDGITRIESVFPEEATRPKKAESAHGTVPMNILVMGSDTRGTGVPDAAASEASNQRADTLMLVHIPGDRKKIYTISLMRDLWISIPGKGEAKINAALAFGGVPLMVQTVEDLFQLRIDHVAIIDFEGFKDLTDSLGGLEVDVKVPFASSAGALKGHEYKAGANAMNGAEALAFVRERYAFTDGDYQRVRNQQAYLKAVINKTTARETLTNPARISEMIRSVSPFISVDNNFDAATVGDLAWGLRDVRSDDTVMFTLPTSGTGTSVDGQMIVVPDMSSISAIATALSRDQLGSYVEAHDLGIGK